MTWVVELLHRDGSVMARVLAPTRVASLAEGAEIITVVTVGRALDNDLVLDDPHCAAHHARLEIADDNTARLIDLMSLNDSTGVVSFSTAAATELSLTVINSAGNYATARAAVNGISFGGSTSIGAGDRAPSTP